LLALALTTLVPRDHQLPDLLAQSRVATETAATGLGCEQLLDFRVDVERLATLRDPAIGPRLDHLADLLLANLGRDALYRTTRALGEILLQREVALADLLQRVAGAQREGEGSQRQRHQHDDDQHDADLEIGQKHAREVRCGEVVSSSSMAV